MNNKFVVKAGDGWQIYVDLMSKGENDIWCEVWGKEAQMVIANPEYKMDVKPGITLAILDAIKINSDFKSNFSNAAWLKAEIAKHKQERELRKEYKPQSDKMSQLFELRDQKIRGYIKMLEQKLATLEKGK